MNVADLAKLVNVSPAAIWHWENRGTIPRRGTFDEIAKALGVSRSFLQTGKQLDGENHRAVGESRMTVGDLSLEELIRAIEIKGFEVSIRSRG
jgi:transcriptional regulator with XRE-family HTH domain